MSLFFHGSGKQSGGQAATPPQPPYPNPATGIMVCEEQRNAEAGCGDCADRNRVDGRDNP